MPTHKHEAIMRAAEHIAQLSIADRRKVGAFIVKNNRIISSGYNGLPAGVEGKCEDEQGNTLPIVLHAEENALRFANEQGISVKGADLFVTTLPCYSCAQLICNAGVRRVFYRDMYRNINGAIYLADHGVEVIRCIPRSL